MNEPRTLGEDTLSESHELARLRAENAALRAALSELCKINAQHDALKAKVAIERALRESYEAECDALRQDAERIDFIERCIRDGSYASILNDIIATCEQAYRTIGTGPAIRSTIDAMREGKEST